jgi:cytochrome c-type biogenesis protein CcmH/NrfF
MNKYIINSLIFLFFSSLSLAYAQDAKSSKSLSAEEIEKITQEISETAMSPFCPGRTISSCPSGQARELRQQITSWLSQGYSRKAVMNQLLNIYGEDVRGMPRKEGFGIMAWIVPALFVLLSVLFVVLLLKSLNSRGQFHESRDEQKELGEESIKMVEQELNKRRG